MKAKNYGKKVFQSILPILVALLVGFIIIGLSGYNPVNAYGQLIKGSLSSPKQIMNTLFASTPILLTGLATTISFKAGLYNMGAEGQLYFGAFAAAIVGFSFHGLSPIVHIPLALVTGMLAGALFAFIPAVLKAYLNVDEMVSTLMLNYVATLLTTWLAGYPFRAPGSSNPETVAIESSATLSRITSSSQLHYGFVIALVVLVLVIIMLKKTKLGYEIETIGKNTEFSKFTGIKVPSRILIIMLISGLIAGLAGAGEVMGTHGKFISGFSPDYGWTGLTIALVGNLNPIGVFVSAILFGILKTGGSTMEIMTGVPRSIISILEGLIVLMVTVKFLNERYKLLERFKHKMKLKSKTELEVE